MTRWVLRLLSTSFVLACTVLISEGYEIRTHAELSLRAVDLSVLDDSLRSQYGFFDGKRQEVGRDLVEDLIARGSAREDDFPRFFSHFHDPLRPWDDSGFGLSPLRSPSAIRWGQEASQDWSWPKVRQYFRQALIAPNSKEREQEFARTFRGLGHLIHLIQDAASPAHTRNDGHLAYNYESLVLDVQSQDPGDPDRKWFVGLLATPHLPDPGWQGHPANPLAPIPIARLLDTDQYQYAYNNPGVTLNALIGLSEYTNANFFSEDRTFPENTNWLFRYPYPARSSVIEIDSRIRLKSGEEVTRRYLSKIADGDTGYRLATVGFLRDYLQRYGLDPNRFNDKPALDEAVYKDYAARLVPRAVGYSAALLDYFFRGQLDFAVYPARRDPAQLTLLFWNDSAETMTGSFTLYTENKEGRRVPVPGASVEGITLSGTGTPDDYLSDSHTITFTPDPAVKIGGLTLVFSGALGAEEGAVVGRVKPWEPMIFVIQEFAELTGEEQVETHRPAVDPETGQMYYWEGRATTTRSKDPRMQRAGGHFLASEGLDAGDFIHRIWLTAGPGNTLRLNGDTDVGLEWSRDRGPALVPRSWEVVVDPTQLPDPNPGKLRFPQSLYVETRDRTQWSAELIWWRRNTSNGESSIYYAPWDCQETNSLLVRSATSTTNSVEVSLGNRPTPLVENGFIPTQGLAGFAPGTFIVEESRDDLHPPCPGNTSFPILFTSVFVDGSSRPTNSAAVRQGQDVFRWVDWSSAGKPPEAPPEAPQLVQELRFQRQYSPEELLWYQHLGITPPEYEIQLR